MRNMNFIPLRLHAKCAIDTLDRMRLAQREEWPIINEILEYHLRHIFADARLVIGSDWHFNHNVNPPKQRLQDLIWLVHTRSNFCLVPGANVEWGQGQIENALMDLIPAAMESGWLTRHPEE